MGVESADSRLPCRRSYKCNGPKEMWKQSTRLSPEEWERWAANYATQIDPFFISNSRRVGEGGTQW